MQAYQLVNSSNVDGEEVFLDIFVCPVYTLGRFSKTSCTSTHAAALLQIQRVYGHVYSRSLPPNRRRPPPHNCSNGQKASAQLRLSHHALWETLCI